MKKHSTSALSKDEHEKQDKLYAEGHTYDYVIIGTGSSALTVGALLANKGYKICLLEYHDSPGGYAHSFKMGDYHFCAQIHYIWSCEPGGIIYEFLKKCGLEKDITFELMDKNGYDRVILPDGKQVMIPYGFENLAKNIEKTYPGELKQVTKFLNTIDKIRTELGSVSMTNDKWWKFIPLVFKIPNLIKYRNSTVQDLFDECKLSKEAQAILCADAGDFMEPPKDLSLIMYTGLFGGYDKGSYYPTKHFKYYTTRLADFITEHEGCHIYFETEVSTFTMNGKKIESAETKDGKIFKADNFICNMDPQKASYMIGREKFPKKYLKKLDYEYSDSGVLIYLGLKDIDLRKYGFGSFNTWHLEQWDMNKMFQEMKEGDFSEPWVFMSTPTLHTDDPSNTPEGGQILELAAYCGYDNFKDRQTQSYEEYIKFKNKIADRMMELVIKHHIPDLAEHIAVKVVGTNVTHEDFCMAVRGNAYGARMTPHQVGLHRLRAKTPFKNLYWCNATSGYPGMVGTVSTGVSLYEDLTNDAVR